MKGIHTEFIMNTLPSTLIGLFACRGSQCPSAVLQLVSLPRSSSSCLVLTRDWITTRRVWCDMRELQHLCLHSVCWLSGCWQAWVAFCNHETWKGKTTSAPDQPLVWPSARTRCLTTHQSCFLILLQKEFEHMHGHSWGKTIQKHFPWCVIHSPTWSIKGKIFSSFWSWAQIKRKVGPTFAVCLLGIQPLYAYTQQ